VGGALTAELGESGSGLNLEEAEHVCALRLAAEWEIFILEGSVEYHIFVVGTISG
jgi:hypothetical protein